MFGVVIALISSNGIEVIKRLACQHVCMALRNVNCDVFCDDF